MSQDRGSNNVQKTRDVIFGQCLPKIRLIQFALFLQRDRIFTIQTFEVCPLEIHASVRLYLDIPPPGLNAINMSGFLVMENDPVFGVVNDITLTAEFSRCSFDLKNCEKSFIFNIKDFCQKMDNLENVWGNIFAAIEPKIKCARPGNYTLKSTRLDLSIFKNLPIEGYVWMLNIKLVHFNRQQKTKKNIMCQFIEAKVERSRKKA